ncbi:hypothetical protein [Dysgonomonas sp. Marseille-P4361]|uniref:hypothetical protein n=1 Tax=Dysgonomonas sp. Marseille-P4361 TaxID=2161820 RepID=UPI000D55AC7F|nr:hypothetical protein [Dysgonomonas sp. Marseille-P4361]
MDRLIEAIQDRLEAQVPELQYIDDDWGQMDDYAQPPVKYPCALIEVQDAEYTDEGELRQRGVVLVTVKLYFMRLSNTSNRAPKSQKIEAHKNWAICTKVNQALHGQDFIKNGFAKLTRKRMSPPKRQDGIYNRNITYSVGFLDESCVPVRKTTPAKPTIKASIQTV